MAYIEVRAVTKKIKDKEVLKDVSMSIDKGQIVGIIGHNGSGKTMLFRAILGLIKIKSGEVYINEEKVQFEEETKENIGALIENPGFMKNETALQNLSYLATIKGLVGKKEILQAMAFFSLDKQKDMKVKKYSLGMKQQLGIVQAFMENQQLILLDEPTNGLDKKAVRKFLELIKLLKEQGKTVLIASHDLVVIDALAEVVYEMENGMLEKRSK